MVLPSTASRVLLLLTGRESGRAWLHDICRVPIVPPLLTAWPIQSHMAFWCCWHAAEKQTLFSPGLHGILVDRGWWMGNPVLWLKAPWTPSKRPWAMEPAFAPRVELRTAISPFSLHPEL